MADDSELLLEPSAAAEALNVSPSGLRRLAPLYEAVFGELPRRGDGAEDKRARLWPKSSVEKLSAARALVDADKSRRVKRYKTIQDALEAIRNGTADKPREVVGYHFAPDEATQEAFGVLLSQMRKLQDSHEALRAEVRELRADRLLPNATALETELKEQQFAAAVLLHTQEATEPTPNNDGVFIKIARRIERFLGRKG